MLSGVGSQGFLTVGYSELSYERTGSILKKTGNELCRKLSSRRRTAGTVVSIILYCLRVGYLKCETDVISGYLRVLCTV